MFVQFLVYLAIASWKIGGDASRNLCSDDRRYFQCGDRTCISKAKVCDGVTNCHDGRDERHCTGNRECVRSQSTPNPNYICRRPCHENSDCRGARKRCVCDDECGKSCLNPRLICAKEPPVVQHAEEAIVKRVRGNRLRSVSTHYTFGDVATYVCERGYTLVGPTPRCNGRGTWSSEVPTCEDSTCRTAVPPIEHAIGYRILRIRNGVTRSYSHDYENVLINDKIMYICEDGFDLEGTLPQCGRNLQFTSSTARCAVSCNRERDEDTIAQHSLHCGRVCDTSSDCGHQEKCICVGPCSRVCVNSDVDCPVAPEADNAQIRYDGSGLGRIARYRCNKGYYLTSGKLSLRCVSSGVWLGEPPICLPVLCGRPYRSIERTGGYAIVTNSTHGGIATFGCDGNRQLIGSRIRECLENGLWSGQLAVCIESDVYNQRRCPHPGIPINGRLLDVDFSVGASVRFECLEDYLMYGAQEQYCTEGRTWSGDGAPICKYYLHPVGEEESVDIFTNAVSQMPRRQQSLSRTIDVNDVYDMQQVFLMFDLSGSVSQLELEDEIGFAIALIERLKDFQKSLQYAVMVFASSSKMLLHFTDKHSYRPDKVIAILRTLTNAKSSTFYLRQETKYGTATGKALEMLGEEIAISTTQNPGRRTKIHVFLFTDGKHTTGRNPVTVRERIEYQFGLAVEFYSITACDDCKSKAMKELKGLSSKGGRNFIHIKDYYQLGEYLKKVTNLEIDYSKCGRNSHAGKDAHRTSLGRVYRTGTNARVTAWPWQVAIVNRSRNSTNLEEAIYDGSLGGGGSVINKNWILTAVHVLKNAENYLGRFSVFLGFFPRLPSKRTGQIDLISLPLQGFDIEKYSLHPEFDHTTFNNDIALIKVGQAIDINFNKIEALPHEIQFNFYVRPICLPCTGTCVTETVLETVQSSDNVEMERCQKEEIVLRAANEKAVVTGYGHRSKEDTNNYRHEESTPVVLRQVLLQIGNQTICANNVRDIGNGTVYNENNICTLPKLNGRAVDACQGDSGGPMVREVHSGNSNRTCWVQIGIVSFGKGCGTGKYPGYFTNVMQYIPWINETIGFTLPGP